MQQVSHFVGLSGVGGVQKNFVDFINQENLLKYKIRHKIYTLGGVDSQYKLNSQVYDIRNPINLFFLMKDIASKRVIVHMYNNLTSLKLAFLMFIVPVYGVILHERGTSWNLPSSRGFFLRFVTHKASVILVNSHASKVMLIKKFYVTEKKIKVLHNGINTSICCTKKNKSTFFCIGFIGRLDTPKGVHVLIDSMRLLSDKNIKLIIAGDGVLNNSLRDQAKNLKNIHFIGRLIEPYSFLNDLDLLIVPSIREPLGNVCLEAGLCKVPVLASNIDGIPEIIEDRVSGELINPDQDILFKPFEGATPLPEYVVDPFTQDLISPKQIDSDVLANKIIQLSNSPDLLNKYGRQLHEKVLNYFNMDRYTNELNSIYSKILD